MSNRITPNTPPGREGPIRVRATLANRIAGRLHGASVTVFAPLFLLIGVFLSLSALTPDILAILAWGPAPPTPAPAGRLALWLVAGLALIFLACPLWSAVLLRRKSHGRGLLALTPPILIAGMAAWQWIN